MRHKIEMKHEVPYFISLNQHSLQLLIWNHFSWCVTFSKQINSLLQVPYSLGFLHIMHLTFHDICILVSPYPDFFNHEAIIFLLEN